jgi:hypothetical protein
LSPEALQNPYADSSYYTTYKCLPMFLQFLKAVVYNPNIKGSLKLSKVLIVREVSTVTKSITKYRKHFIVLGLN